MVRSTKVNSTGRTKTVVQGTRGKRPEIPVNKAESSAVGDRNSMILFCGMAGASAIGLLMALLWGIVNIASGIGNQPNWIAIISGIVIIGAALFIVRGLAWLSFFAAIMFAMKNGAWKTQEHLCRLALKYWRLFPGGGGTAATMLVQSLVNRGQYDEAATAGKALYDEHARDPKSSQNLAGMYVTIGMACSFNGNTRESIVWNERAIEALSNSINDMTAKKSWLARIAGGQAKELAASLQSQLALVTFNNATCYLSLQNNRQAKAQFKKALDSANTAPDFAEKRELIKQCGEALSRLKHT